MGNVGLFNDNSGLEPVWTHDGYGDVWAKAIKALGPRGPNGLVPLGPWADNASCAFGHDHAGVRSDSAKIGHVLGSDMGRRRKRG